MRDKKQNIKKDNPAHPSALASCEKAPTRFSTSAVNALVGLDGSFAPSMSQSTPSKPAQLYCMAAALFQASHAPYTYAHSVSYRSQLDGDDFSTIV